MKKVLDVQKLQVKYHTAGEENGFLEEVSFSVGKGETVGIVGESGSGKTTAILAVMGLLKKRADVKWETLSVSGGVPVPGKNVAMIFQDSMTCLNPTVKVGRQIMETIRARRKCSRKEARDRAGELLDLVGIHNPALRMKQYPFELSGGMRQRVVIAIALACEPDLIIADEPTTALDAAVQAQILVLLRRVVRETKTALLLVSHDMGVTASLCTRVYVMQKGRIVESGTAEEIFYFPTKDYTKQLLQDAKGARRMSLGPVGEEVLFSMEDVTKAFDTQEGVSNVSLEIRAGEIFALVGESGSGKTTLAKIMTGVLREDSGKICYRGQRLDRKMQTTGCGGRIQMVFQDPYASLNPCLTVGEALEEALTACERYKGGTDGPGIACSHKERIEEILLLTGLRPEDVQRYPEEFSGGQRQRIGIARALITEPEILVCDEALSSLDATTREQILELLLHIQKERKIACLFISHDIHVVRRISARMGVMHGGRMVESGSTKEICRDPWHPYTKQLLEAVPEPDPLRASKIRASVFRERDQKKGSYPAWGSGLTGGCPFAGRCGYALECCEKEAPRNYSFGSRQVFCFLYSEEHSGRRDRDYRMTSQI